MDLKKHLFFTCCLALSLGLATPSAFAQGRSISKANAYYREGRWNEALKIYDEAITKSPDDTLQHFNRGAVYYKKEDYAKARESFQKALASENRGLEAKASYNMANTLYRLAGKAGPEDVQNQKGLMEQALLDYKRSLEIDPQDTDAKYNYEVVSRKLQELSERQKTQKTPSSGGDQENPQQKKQPEENQKQEEKEKSQENKSDGTRPEESPKPAEEGEKQAGPDGKKEGPAPPPEQNQETENKGQAQVPKQMTDAEARMLLQNFGREGPRLQLNDRQQSATRRSAEKDW